MNIEPRITRLRALAAAVVVTAQLLTAASVSARSPASAPVTAPGLTKVDVASGTLVGTYYAPADGKRHPAIVVLGGSEGGLHAADAQRFAQHGYAALALAYFGIDPLPKELSAIPVETVTRGIDWLAARPEVDRAHIGIEGGSKGAELALLAATRDSRIRAVAVVAPTAYVWFGLAFGSGAPETSSWSAGGTPVPYVPSDTTADAAVGRAFQRGGTISFRDTFDASLASATAATRTDATIPVERIGGPVLCIAGDDDHEWNSVDACNAIHARRHAARRDASDAVVVEHGAGHALPFSGAPAAASYQATPITTILLGGSPEANGRGGADAFTRIVAFFNHALNPTMP
ncbi:MAG TPA: acyl-CoA thioester hydrolase/BAAT C-terminal domain-containing protein [Candidatus Elarobacter sp.]|jgi:dienelactone hydrolase|nr:acyl-CoA thioester hydrolase/BAAT C-terminal domain-containing protein [Candidatus Elarobacter sp.]